MRYAIIENGLVANVALADDADFAEEQGWIACPNHAGPGWLFDGEAFTPPAPPAPIIPEVVTIRQAKLALLAGGLLDDADAAVAAAGQAAQIEWEYATEVRRDNALVTGIGAALGLSGDQIDALFVAAAAIG